ncbi:MAG: hypothetical protein AUK35_09495 [Zetaproteobacteria bacterium CG2_30_46_52]|nr:MAG: hypothetical protein AUK35_09495 [Zetaproteobacteria bacterium CG2_30_46_52]
MHWFTHVKERLYQRHMRWRLFGFARVMFWGDKFEARFSFLGRWLLAAVLLTLVFGANIKKSDIYQMFAVLLAVLLVALVTVWVRSLSKSQPLQIKRLLPALAQVGQEVSYAVHLHNLELKPMYDVKVMDVLSRQYPSVHQFLTVPEPLEEKRNWYDRKTGFYRFVWLQRWLTGGEIQAQSCEKIDAGETQAVMLQWRPEKRGYLHFETLRTSVPDPLGLVYNNQNHHLPQSVLVLPKVYAVPHALISQGNSKDEQVGHSISADVGDSEAFFRMREYRPGDSPRHIHWASLARGEKPLVKEFENEFFARQTLIIDNAASSELSLLFEELVSVAAGFVEALHTSDGVLDVLFAPQETTQPNATPPLSMQAGSGQSQAVLEVLASIDLYGEESFLRLQERVWLQQAFIHSCVLLTLIWDERRQAWVEELRQQGIEVVVYVITPSLASSELVQSEGVRVLRQGFINEDLRALVS